MEQVKVGSRHAGKWVWGLPIVKVVWSQDRLRLSSGFVAGAATSTKEANLALKAELDAARARRGT